MSSAAAVELLSCDFIVAAADATFRQIEVSVGKHADGGRGAADGRADRPVAGGALRDAVAAD
jgi:hypothetical protein